VNGKLVASTDEVDDLISNAGFLDVDVIFIQAKTSQSFDGSEIGTFIHGVKEFVSETPSLVLNEKVSTKHDIWDHILSRSGEMIRRLPSCKLYYATTGNWSGDQNLVSVINSGVRELQALNLFEIVTFVPCGASEIQRYYRDTKNKLSVTINFANKITLPEIQGVSEAYFGVLPFSEFRKLIIDDNGNIFNVFYDNVRDFQGDNPVNSGIKKTLNDGKFDLFSVLNNGVTVVADSITPAGNRFTLRDYQIVNGCQTSHVLYESSNIEGIDSVNIPVRLVVTADEEIRNQITLATNSQTEVKPEQLEAQNEFQKNLELYYSSVFSTGNLYYERRSQQYHSHSDVKKTQIITIPVQIKSFSSMFLNLPHNVSGYYRTIVKKFNNQIFNK
jgi:AIPR protein